MFTFFDENGYKVDLSFDEGKYDIPPKHILVFVLYKGKWLCTIHKERGIEFPGGKVEGNETLQQAAIREVYEETAVRITDLKWFASYVVHTPQPFCKVVYTAKVKSIDQFVVQHETLGLTWLSTEDLLNHSNLSFYMKDEGMKKMLQEVKSHEREW